MVRVGRTKTRLHSDLSERDQDLKSHPTLYLLEADHKPATKEIFVPVTVATEMVIFDGTPGGLIDAAAEEAGVMLLVPHDFASITTIELIFVAKSTQTAMKATFWTRYAAKGQLRYADQETASDVSIGDVTDEYIYGYDLSGLVDAGPLAAGDYLSVRVLYSATAPTTNIIVLGVRLRYS